MTKYVKQLRIVIPLGVAILAATGCGGNGGPLTAAGGSLNSNQLQSAEIGQRFTDLLNNLKPNANPSVRSFPTGVGFVESPYDSCRTQSPGPTIDNDGDGIPVLLETKYSCSGVSGDEGFYSDLIGTYRVRDFDDSLTYARGGYRYDYDLHYISTNRSTHFFDFSFLGYYSAETTRNSLRMASDFQSSVEGEDNGVKMKFTYQTTFSATYHPADMATPYAAGTLNMEGFFKLEGMLSDNLPDAKVVFKFVGKDLVYEYPGCTQYYKSGTIAFSDGANNQLVYTFNCNTAPIITFNGEAQFMSLTP